MNLSIGVLYFRMAERLAKVLEHLIHQKEISSVVDVLEQSCSKKPEKPSKPLSCLATN